MKFKIKRWSERLSRFVFDMELTRAANRVHRFEAGKYHVISVYPMFGTELVVYVDEVPKPDEVSK